MYLALSVTDYLGLLIQLTAFGEEQEISPWGVKVFGDKVIILRQVSQSFSIHGLLLLSLNCLDAGGY